MGRPPTRSTAETLKEYFASGVNKKKWAEAQDKAKQAGSYAEYNDGKYEAQLINAVVNRAEKSGRLQTVLTFRFTSGEYKGKTVKQYQGVEDQGITYLLRTLKTLGYEDVNSEDIEDDVFPKLKKQKPVVNIRLKTNDGSEYQNLYVVGLAETSPLESEDDDDESDNNEAVESEEDFKPTKAVDEDDDEEGEAEVEEEDSEDDEDEEKPQKKEKSKPAVDDDDEDEEDEKPAVVKKTKPAVVEKDEDEVEEDTDEEKVGLEVGMKLKVRVDGKPIKSTLLSIISERKDGTGEIRVESIKTGKKYVVAVPDDVIDVLS